MPDAFQNKYINKYLLTVAPLLVSRWGKERGAGCPCDNPEYCSRTWRDLQTVRNPKERLQSPSSLLARLSKVPHGEFPSLHFRN